MTMMMDEKDAEMDIPQSLPEDVEIPSQVSQFQQQLQENQADKRKMLRRDTIPALLNEEEEIPAKHCKIDVHSLVDEKDAEVDIPQSHPGEVEIQLQISHSQSDSDL